MTRVSVKKYCFCLLACLAIAAQSVTVPARAGTRAFDVAPHSHALIEWWYANAHFTSAKGHRLAVVVSFFKTGNGSTPFTGSLAVPVGHYLIVGVTDLTARSHKYYSYADHNMVRQLALIAPLIAMKSGNDPTTLQLVKSVMAGQIPPPSRFIDGDATIAPAPLSIHYGSAASLDESPATHEMRLQFKTDGGGAYDLYFAAERPIMAVGGSGETGFTNPTDMYYFSTTHCAVHGTVRIGGHLIDISSGLGWYDHQWGSSWGVENDGWDWLGIQLNDGRDILAYRQRHLDTGGIGVTAATTMSPSGKLTVETKAQLTPIAGGAWTSPHTSITYPLSWTLVLPGQNVRFIVTPDVKDQEVRVLAGGRAIWEGACTVTGKGIRGVAFLELVGYSKHENMSTK